MSSCLKHANQTLNAMAVIASSLSLFLGIAYLLRNMYLCSLIQDSNNDYEYLLAELKNRLKISIFLWRKSCASR